MALSKNVQDLVEDNVTPLMENMKVQFKIWTKLEISWQIEEAISSECAQRGKTPDEFSGGSTAKVR